MDEITNPDDEITFLQHFKQLNENIEYAITKRFKVDIDIVPNDLPRELAERKLLDQHYEAVRELCKQKDETIFKLGQELKQKYDCYQEEFDRETRQEMNEWAKLVDKYAQELKKYDMVCAYCGQTLNPLTVNTECADNNGSNDNLYTEQEPDGHPRNKHGFGRPRSTVNSPLNVSRISNPVSHSQRADEFLKKNVEHHDLIGRLSVALNRQTLIMDGVS